MLSLCVPHTHSHTQCACGHTTTTHTEGGRVSTVKHTDRERKLVHAGRCTHTDAVHRRRYDLPKHTSFPWNAAAFSPICLAQIDSKALLVIRSKLWPARSCIGKAADSAHFLYIELTHCAPFIVYVTIRFLRPPPGVAVRGHWFSNYVITSQLSLVYWIFDLMVLIRLDNNCV